MSEAISGRTDFLPHEVQGRPFEVTIASALDQAHLLEARIEQSLRALRYSEQDVFCVKLALEEALVNAIKHGNQMDRVKKVHVRFHATPDRFDVRITDEGPGFNAVELPDPTMAENLERPCGRGIMFMRHYMTAVEYHEPGNSVSMSKLRNDGVLRNGHQH